MTVRSVSTISPDCRCYVLSRLTLLVFATLLLRPTITLGQQPSLTANLVAENPSLRQGILLLRNGQLLGGQYTLTGFGYEVQLNGGGVIRLREEQVEFTSDSIDEVYLFQRASHVNSSASAHLKMANWCLANQLYEYADNHLKEAIRIDPREKGIIPIQSRLAIARSPQKATTPKTQIHQRPLASQRNDCYSSKCLGAVGYSIVCQPNTTTSFKSVRGCRLSWCKLTVRISPARFTLDKDDSENYQLS